jgi:Domain of Unknown Function with PDB structure (DUF3857)
VKPRFAVLVILCVVIGARLAGAQEPPAAKSPATKTPELAAQIELLETHVRFEANGDSRKEVHARVHINNEFGVPQFARLNFDYNRAFQQVEIPLVRITHASGGTAEILPSAITDQPNPAVVNAPAYQDVRVKSVRILGLAPGDNLEYRVITTTTHHPLAPDFWLDHTFDRSGVVSHEIFELDLPGPLNSVTTMSPVLEGTRPVVYLNVPYTSRRTAGDETSTRSIYLWDIPSKQKLPSPQNESVPVPDLLVSTFPDWGYLITRLASGFSSSEVDRKEVASEMYSLAPHAKTQESRLRAAYEFVSQKIATLDLPVGASGFRLRHGKEIIDSGYATPEEKCALLVEFAEALGVRAEIFFAAGDEAPKQFARPSVLTRVFVIVSDRKSRIALDPSLDIAPFGLVTPQFRGKPTIRLASYNCGDLGKWKWSPLPWDIPFAASQHVNVDATLSADGTLTSKVHYAMRGDNELLLRVAFHQAARDKWNEVAQLLALSDGFRGKVTRVTASDPYDTKNPFTVEYEITQPKFVDWSKTPVRIPALLPVVGLPSPSAKTEAGGASGGEPGAIELGTPLDVDTRVALHLPPETSAEVPTGTSVARDYAKFASEYTVNGATITASRHLTFLLREVPGSRAADYNAFVRAVQTDEAQEFRLNRAAPADTKSGSKRPRENLLRTPFLPLKEPMHAVFVGEMSVRSKRQIPQIIKQRSVCSGREPVENYSQLFVLPAVNVHGDCISLLRRSRRMQPVCC